MKGSHIQRTRDKIAATKMVDKLIQHFNGEREMTTSQVNVGLKLINKLVPDLKQVDSVNEHTHNLPKDIKITLVEPDEQS